MLILHRSLHIPVSHGSHDGSQVSGSLQNLGAVIMPSPIEDKIFGKPSFDPSFAKSLRHCGEMSRLGAFRRENPSFAFFSAPLFKNVKDAIAHRHASPSFSNHGGSEGRDFLSERYGLISSVNALWPIEPVPVVMTVPSHNAFLDR